MNGQPNVGLVGASMDPARLMEGEYVLAMALLRCACGPYLARRRAVLIPAVLAQAEVDGTEPADVLTCYLDRVHARHLSGLPLTTPLSTVLAED